MHVPTGSDGPVSDLVSVHHPSLCTTTFPQLRKASSHPKASYGSSKKRPVTKYRKAAVDVRAASGSDLDFSIASRTNSGSEDDEHPSDDDLTRKAPGMSEKEFSDLYRSEVSPPSLISESHLTASPQQVKILRPEPPRAANDLFNSDENVVPARSSSRPSQGLSEAGRMSTSNVRLHKDPDAAPPRKHSTKVSN